MAQVWTYAITAAVRRGDPKRCRTLDPDLCHDAAARRGRVQAGRPLPTRNGQSRWALLAPGDRSQADKFRSIPPNGRYQAAVVAHFSDVNVAHGRSRPGTSPGGESR